MLKNNTLGAILMKKCALLSMLTCLRIIPMGSILTSECASDKSVDMFKNNFHWSDSNE